MRTRFSLTVRHGVDAETDLTPKSAAQATGWRLHPRIVTVEDGANSSLVASEWWEDGRLDAGRFRLFGQVQVGDGTLPNGQPEFGFDETTVTVEQIELFAAMLLKLASEVRRTKFAEREAGYWAGARIGITPMGRAAVAWMPEEEAPPWCERKGEDCERAPGSDICIGCAAHQPP